MRRYAHASAEKALYEESLQNKTKESGRLRSNLEVLKRHSSGVNSQEIDNTVERLSVCEMEIAELKERLEKLEGVIQEEDMQARRGKSVIMVGTKMTEKQFAAALREKEEEYKRLLKEQKDEQRRRMEEEVDIQLKDLKHQVEIQKTQLQVKELELRDAGMKQEFQTGSYYDSQKINVSRIPPPSILQSSPLPQYHHPSLITTSPPQFAVLLKELRHLADQWETIGIVLEIEDVELQIIKANNQSDTNACLREMLRAWLHRFYPPPSWSAVIDTLHALGHVHLANRLETKYLV